MDDLTRYLYEFVWEKRLGSLSEDEEYKKTLEGIEMQEARVKGYLDKEQQRELRLLLEELSAQSSIEQEHLFQASLLLVRELNGLVRA